MSVFRLIQITALIVVLFNNCVDAKAAEKVKSDPNDNKGNTPFFLQDPYDKTCLGPKGFTVCDERSLWILTKRAGKKTYSLVSLLLPSTSGMCLERKTWFFGLFGDYRVGMGKCSKSGSKNWEFNFVDNTHVKLSSKGQCIVRGKDKYKSSVTVQNCNKKEFLPLIYHATTVHETGFNLKAADGQCFDGSAFRDCEGSGSNMLFWGVGIKYIWGNANRYLFNFHQQDRGNCIVAHGSKVEKSPCTSSGAMKWGLSDGKLSINNEKMCLARLPDDSGAMAKCSEASEYMSMDIPTVYTPEDIEALVRNKDNLNPEEAAVLAQAIKQHSMTRRS